MSDKPKIPLSEVHKAQALGRHHAGQQARAQGYDLSAMLALATYGKPTEIQHDTRPLVLLPQTLQVQLALIEHAKLFPASETAASVADGIERLTHLALIYSDPGQAFEILTDTAMDDDSRRREFRHEAFQLAECFDSDDAINKLTAHIAVQMRLAEGVMQQPEKKPEPPAPTGRGKRRPPHRRS